jgi:hypothetical protein
MKGILVLSNNYTYEGDILYNEPHGFGSFHYTNGDRYVGQCQFGRSDGYGTYYYKSGATYIGYFSFGKFHGVGTFEDSKNITKGSWRLDRKHGHFIKTNKIEQTTVRQLWIKHRIRKEETIQYIPPNALKTTAKNPNKQPKTLQITYKGTHIMCIGCSSNPVSACNPQCGHVCMCYDCLNKCDKCPICRCGMEQPIKLFIS